MVRSLADDLRARSDEELRRLLVLRPDLARPAPSDVTALCARAATLASTTRAVDHLAEERLDVLVGCAALEGAERAALDGVDEPVAAGLVELTGLTGEGVSAHLLELRDAALLWRSPDGLRPTRAVLEALGPYPGGLGPPATELELDHLTDAEIRAQHAEAPSAAARVLERLADAGPVATVAAQEQSGEAARWLADAGLAAVSPDPADGARLRVVLPREVVVALRGGSLRRREEPTAKGASPGSSTLHRSGVAHDPRPPVPRWSWTSWPSSTRCSSTSRAPGPGCCAAEASRWPTCAPWPGRPRWSRWTCASSSTSPSGLASLPRTPRAIRPGA